MEDGGKKSASFELATRTDWALALPPTGRLSLAENVGSGRRSLQISGLIHHLSLHME